MPTDPRSREAATQVALPAAVLPVAVTVVAVVLVAVGLSRGVWLSNLHNGALALAFTSVGAYVLHQRPGHPEGRVFVLTGLAEAVLFLGRQVGHAHPDSTWWAWVGVWPVALVLALTTVAVLCFPDGRLPSTRWRPVVVLVVVVAAGCAAASAVWPVEYASAGISAPHPVDPTPPPLVSAGWSAVAHPAYAVFQLLWVLAAVSRWRTADDRTRRQLRWVLAAAAGSGVALLVGLVGWGSPTAGLLTAALVPVAAGAAIVHARQADTRTALTWLSRSPGRGPGLAADLARAAATALDADRAVLWSGSQVLQSVGEWPPTDGPRETVDRAEALRGVVARDLVVDGTLVGALGVVPRTGRTTLAQDRLLDDLAAQATLVVEHLGLAAAVVPRRKVPGLTPREQDVLELMARGLSNPAIAQTLHLSVKTVEPVVSAVFTKLGLAPDTASNRRVLAVLSYLQR